MITYISIFITAIFVKKTIEYRRNLLGICPFLGVSKEGQHGYRYGGCPLLL